MSDFPGLLFEPGAYDCEWFINDRRISGRIELFGSKVPELTLYADVPPPVEEPNQRVYTFGRQETIKRLVGRLRSNHDVVVFDANVQWLLPELSMGVARYAIVGAGVAATPEDTYERILLQVTGADLLIGSSPVGSYSQPKRATASSKSTYSVTLSEERHRRWETDDGATAITCGYDHRPLLGRYRFEVAFAPVFEFTSKTPLSLEDWLSLLVEPLLQITSTAIGTPQ